MNKVFKSTAKEAFWNLTVEFTESLAQVFPDCPETKDMLLYTKNIVRGDASLEEEGIQTWYERMMEPLNKKVKYAKAVERITGKPACIYHACVYKDASAIQNSTTSERFARLGFEEKLADDKFTDEDKEAFWKFLQEINRHCFEFLQKPVPTIPTRDEIQKNIQSRNLKDSSGSSNKTSMFKGFVTSLSAFNASREQPPVYKYEDDETMKLVMEKWTLFSKETVDDEDISKLCTMKDQRVIPLFSKTFDQFNWESPLSDTQWTLLSKVFSYCAVGDSIPTNMMGKIEDMANLLAEDIVSGKRDLNSLDLNEIGQQVLSQVNSKDVDKFANNIDTILPAITRLKN